MSFFSLAPPSYDLEFILSQIGAAKINLGDAAMVQLEEHYLPRNPITQRPGGLKYQPQNTPSNAEDND
jgi:hypothetical protein